jgi:hypothetical protein
MELSQDSLNEQPELLSALRRADRGDFTELKRLAARCSIDV